nr:MAG TPA: hypothetical protein [Caudoviricetes sp.]
MIISKRRANEKRNLYKRNAGIFKEASNNI